LKAILRLINSHCLNLKYLKHLAQRGASYIHPRGHNATRMLIGELSPQSREKILEIGCGTGATIAEIASVYDVVIDGVDLLDEMLSAARKRMKYLNIHDKVNLYKINPGAGLPFSDNEYDKIYAESVIGFQNKESIKVILNEANRVLKKGGILVLNEALWKENVDDKTVSSIYETSEKDFGLAQASGSNIDLRSLLSICGECGFQPLKQINLDVLNGRFKQNELSKKFEFKMKIRSLLSLKYILNEISFRRKLARHKNDGVYISSWLLKFVKG
jgi:SAM-dependent methyltransferase